MSLSRLRLESSSSWLLRVLFTLSALLVTAGCGSGSTSEDTAHWQGTVTIGGNPLPADAVGSITFRPVGESSAKPVTVQIVDGTYDSPATPRGKVKAYVNVSKPTGRTMHSDRTGQDVPEMESIVPPERSMGIDLDVEGDNSEANIEL